MINFRKMLFFSGPFYVFSLSFRHFSKIFFCRAARNAFLGTDCYTEAYCCLHFQIICYFVPRNPCVGINPRKSFGLVAVNDEFQMIPDLFHEIGMIFAVLWRVQNSLLQVSIVSYSSSTIDYGSCT